MGLGAKVQTSAATRFTIPVPAGDVRIALTEGLGAGSWRFRASRPTEVRVDFLDPQLCSIPGVEPIECNPPANFIPTPRLRFEVNGSTHDLVSSDAGILERHYSRPRHQEVSYPGPDPWTDGFHQSRIRQARRLLSGVSGRVCDVGSGYSLLAMAGPWEFELCACDRDSEAIQSLKDRGFDAVIGPAEDPPYSPGSFDAIYAGEIIEHVVDPLAALRNWVLLLRPGGRLVVTTPNRRHWLARARGYEKVENLEHLFEWDISELRRAVRRAGATVESVEGLLLTVPVYLPRRGWRDVGFGIVRRFPVPRSLLIRYVELGRFAPNLAWDLAIVARRPT